MSLGSKHLTLFVTFGNAGAGEHRCPSWRVFKCWRGTTKERGTLSKQKGFSERFEAGVKKKNTFPKIVGTAIKRV